MRPPTDVENILLSLEARRLINARDLAEDARKKNPTRENDEEVDRTQAEYDAAAPVFERAGRASSGSLYWRRLMFEADFSAAALERKVKMATDLEKLPAEMRAEIEKAAENVRKAEEERDRVRAEEEAKRAELEAELVILRAQKEVNRGARRVARNKRKADTQAEIAELWKEFNSIGRQANAGLDPKAVAIVFKLAVKYAKLGSITFEQFADEMIQRGGDAVKPHLKAAWDEAQASKKKELAAVIKANRPLMKQRSAIRKMVEQLVSDGVTDRDAVVDAVWEAVKPSYPQATRREVIDAISGYGEYKQFTKDENKRKAADIRLQLLQVAKIEDLLKGLAAKKTGFERPEQSKAVRDLTRDYNALKRKLKIESEGEDTLRSAEDAIKRRLENRLEDLREAIKEREPIVRDKGKPITSPEIERLRAEVKAAQAEYDALFAPADTRPDPTVKRLEEEIQELERRIQTGEAAAPSRARQGPPTEQVNALRQRKQELQEQLRLAERSNPANFKPDPKIARLQKEIEALERGEAAKPRGQRQGPPTEEVLLLEKRKQELRQALKDEENAKRPDPQVERLKEQIAEVDRQLAGGEPAVRRERQGPNTAEVAQLRSELEAKRKELAERKGTPLARYIESAQKTLAELERRLATGQLKPEPGKPKPTNEELDMLRAQIKAKREEIALARGDKKTPDERRLQAFKTRKANELAKLLERNFYGLYEDPRPTKRTPKELKLDEEAAAVNARVEAERRKAKALVAKYERENATPRQRVASAIKGSVELFRSIKSAWDLSAVLRQGVMFTVAHPYRALTEWIPGMFKAMFSAEEAAKIDAMLRNRDTVGAKLPGARKLELTTLDGPLTSREEHFRSTLAERFPGVKASERAFTTYLNLQRAAMFDSLVDRSMSQEEVEVIAQFVNIATGRGDFGKWKQVSAGASYILWSPSLLLSRIQLATGYSLWGGTAKSRKIVAKQYARTLIGLAAYYAAISLFMEMGDDDETYIGTDPRSSEFGKIVSGNTVLDPLGGVSQVMVLGSRIGTQVAANLRLTDADAFATRDGDTRELKFDDLANFLRTKATPVLGLSIDLILGEGVYGRELPGPVEMVAPISVFDVKETMEEEGLVKGSVLSILQLLGQGTNIYSEQ